ncbi:hypothetical protein D3C76_681870 [compost metagenome]
MLAAIDLRRPPFHQRRAQRIGAARRLAPAGALGDVGEAAALQLFARTFHGEDGGVGIGEDDQTVLALALMQIVQLGGGGIQQQAVVGQEDFRLGAVVQHLLGATVAVQAMFTAAPP